MLNANIKNLQNEFRKNVIENNIYKKRFKNYLSTFCEKSDILCLNQKIDSIRTWESTPKDKKLQYLINKRLKRTTISNLYFSKVQNKILKKLNKINAEKSQFISIIDLSKQLMILVLYNENKELQLIGSDLISSGDMQREKSIKYGENHYFDTPAAIYISKRGWRSTGDYKEDNRTQGYGQKDRYIFYFGKILAKRYNTFDQNKEKIPNKDDWNLVDDYFEFAMHAHEADTPKGKAYSHGCIRLTNELNIFLDNNLFLHHKSIINNKWKHPYSQKPIDMKNKKFVGKYLIIEERF